MSTRMPLQPRSGAALPPVPKAAGSKSSTSTGARTSTGSSAVLPPSVPSSRASTGSARPSSAGPTAAPTSRGGSSRASSAAPSSADDEPDSADARLFHGTELFKFHTSSIGPAESRIFQVFLGAELPAGSIIEAPNDATPAPRPSTRELYLAYRHAAPKGFSLKGMLGGGKSGSENWRAFPLSTVEWVRSGQLSSTFNRAQKHSVPLPAPALCFSVEFVGGTNLAAYARTTGDASAWVGGLKFLVKRAKASIAESIAAALANMGSGGGGGGGSRPSSAAPNKDAAAAEAARAAAAKDAARRKAEAERAIAAKAALAEKTAAEEAAAAAAAAADGLGSGAGGEWSDADRRMYFQQTLFPAIKAGRFEDVELALNDGCPLDLIDERTGDNALLAACRAGDLVITQFCLLAAVPFMPYGPEGRNALQAAVQSGSLPCVEAILIMASEASDEDDQVRAIAGCGMPPTHSV